MFKKSRKDKITDQAQGLVKDLSDAVAPRLEQARDELAPRVSEARDAAAARIAEARKQFDEQVAPQLDEARQKVSEELRTRIDEARQSAMVVAGEAERRGSAAASALKGEEVEVKPKTSKFKRLLLVLGLAALGAVVAKKLTGDQHADNWQSSYTPAPAPTPAPSPAAPAAGASPGETVADSAEEPHPVTTPDDPAEAVELKSDEKP